MDSKIIRAQLKIRGRVQGVCYRACARDRAIELGVFGWVRNCQDGSVEAVAEGSADSVEDFIRWCQRGPRAAEVAEVQVQRAEPHSEFDRFEIRY